MLDRLVTVGLFQERANGLPLLFEPFLFLLVLGGLLSAGLRFFVQFRALALEGGLLTAERLQVVRGREQDGRPVGRRGGADAAAEGFGQLRVGQAARLGEAGRGFGRPLFLALRFRDLSLGLGQLPGGGVVLLARLIERTNL